MVKSALTTLALAAAVGAAGYGYGQATAAPAAVQPAPAAASAPAVQPAAAKRGEPQRVGGTCRAFTGQVVAYACVPTKAPDGGRLVQVFEDGSATYKGGWTFDGDTELFHKG